jgi:hypothetical protein
MRLSDRFAVGSPTTRLAAIVATTMVLAMALAGTVMAGASPSPYSPPACSTEVVPVSGVTIFGHEEPGTARWSTATGEHIHNMTFISELDLDDDRLDGMTTYLLDWDFGGSGDERNGIMQGIYRIENDEGVWEGPLTGIGDELNSWRAVSTGAGSGAYEGFAVTLYHLSSDTEADGLVEGVIYPSDIAACDVPTVE